MDCQPRWLTFPSQFQFCRYIEPFDKGAHLGGNSKLWSTMRFFWPLAKTVLLDFDTSPLIVNFLQSPSFIFFKAMVDISRIFYEFWRLNFFRLVKQSPLTCWAIFSMQLSHFKKSDVEYQRLQLCKLSETLDVKP